MNPELDCGTQPQATADCFELTHDEELVHGSDSRADLLWREHSVPRACRKRAILSITHEKERTERENDQTHHRSSRTTQRGETRAQPDPSAP